MADLKGVEATLPPGFRFSPSDEELVSQYLYKKICNEKLSNGTMVEVNLHICEPWQLPDVAKLGPNEWYFFSFRDRKYATGFRTNRATTSGYWKATGKDRTVIDSTTHVVIGMRKTLVFYTGRAPNGIKTGWVMHEFRLENPHMPPQEDWVLCRVSHKVKGELTTKLVLGNEFDSTSSPLQQLTPFPQNQDYQDNPFLDFPWKVYDAPIKEIGATNGDESGFLLNLDEMRMEDENSMIFP